MNNEDIKSRINTCLNECEIAVDSSLTISSLTLVTLAVKLEKAFGIRFTLDEIAEENFNTFEKIQSLVIRKNTK